MSCAGAGLAALIWDVDGTLAETERDGHRLAFNRAFEEAGLDWHWDVARYGELLAVTGGRERLLHDWRVRNAGSEPGAREQALIAALHARKNQHYADRVGAGGIAPRPGVRRLIEAARDAGLRLAIATTTSRVNVSALLHAVWGSEANGVFEVCVCGEDVRQKKPSAEVYRLALGALRLSAARCVAIEDSQAGLAAAQGATLPCVVTRGIYSAPGEWPHGVACCVADLDGLGEPGAPAHGRVAGEAWSGVVGLRELRDWIRA